MAVSVSDILQITDVQTYLNQTMLNVYFYRADVLGSAVGYQEIADVFQTQVVLEVKGMQSSDAVHTNTIIKNLTNGLDIFEDAINIAGDGAFAAGPSFVAASFRLLRSTAATRHGAKRIGGLTEDFYTGNDIASGFVTFADDAAAAIGAPLVVESAGDLDIELMPVIVGRFPTSSPDAGQLNLSVINPIREAQFIRVSTQTTRRAGRGV